MYMIFKVFISGGEIVEEEGEWDNISFRRLIYIYSINCSI